MRCIVLSLFFLLLAACVSKEGADTFGDAGVLSGSILTRQDCDQWPNTSVWVEVDGQGECIRYFHAGLQKTNDIVHIWFHGDRMSQSLDGRAWVHGYYAKNANPSALADKAQRELRNFGLPYVRFSRPGLYGSSGSHKERRLPREIAIIDAAVDALKVRYGVESFALSGQSGGGHVVASLLTRRSDIRCAVATSGVLSVRKRSIIRGWGGRDITGFSSYFDPIDHIEEIPSDPERRIFIVGDPNDKNVPFSTQADYHEALAAARHNTTLIRATGKGRENHGLSHVGFKVITDCVEGRSNEEIIGNTSMTKFMPVKRSRQAMS